MKAKNGIYLLTHTTNTKTHNFYELHLFVEHEKKRNYSKDRTA
jgi:hypothetical protein